MAKPRPIGRPHDGVEGARPWHHRGRARATKRRANRGSLPSHLPRIEMVLDIEDHSCPCCHGALHMIGEARAERPTSCPPSSESW
jgi:transposase